MSSELKNGVYTIRSHRVPGTVATLPGEDVLPGTPVVLLPPSVIEAPGQEVVYSDTPHVFILMIPRLVASHETRKWRIYHHQPGKPSIV